MLLLVLSIFALLVLVLCHLLFLLPGLVILFGSLGHHVHQTNFAVQLAEHSWVRIALVVKFVLVKSIFELVLVETK